MMAHLFCCCENKGRPAVSVPCVALHSHRVTCFFQLTSRLLQDNRSIRDAFLKLPRDVDGTVKKDVLKSELQRALPQMEVQTLLSSVPEQVSYDDFVKRISVPDVTSGRILPHTPKETGTVVSSVDVGEPRIC
jgi:hypothetical protein